MAASARRSLRQPSLFLRCSCFFFIGLLAHSPIGAETRVSPFVKGLERPEKVLYVWAGDSDQRDSDFLVTVDVDPASEAFGRVIHKLPVHSKGNEAHHFGFTDDRTRIWAGGLFSDRIFIIDVAENPRRPKLERVLTNIRQQTGLASPHTFYAIPGRMLVTFLSSADGGIPAGVAEFTNSGKFIRRLPLGRENGAPEYMYDLAVKPELNSMVTSSFTPYRNFSRPFSEMNLGDFGNALYFWDFRKRRIEQVIRIDKSPLELRWALRSGADYGFVNCALGDSLWMWRRRAKDRYTALKIADLGKGCMPAGLRVAPDDATLYVSCFGTHEIQQWDVSVPERAVKVGSISTGVQPNRMHLSADGKRLYVTNSLLSTIDFVERFYLRLVHIGPDGMKLDPDLDIDFNRVGLRRYGLWSTGSSRPRDMLLN